MRRIWTVKRTIGGAAALVLAAGVAVAVRQGHGERYGVFGHGQRRRDHMGNRVSCAHDKDYVGLGGGFDLGDDTNFVMTGEYPLLEPLDDERSGPNDWDHAWHVAGYKRDKDTNSKITVAILCAKITNDKKWLLSTPHAEELHASVLTETVTCLSGYKAVAGGVNAASSRFAARHWTTHSYQYVANKAQWNTSFARANEPDYTPPGPGEETEYEVRKNVLSVVICLAI